MTQKISIILDYKDYIDIRFLSNFLYHLKASTTYIYKHKYKNDIKELINFIDESFANSDSQILKLNYILSILSNNINFRKIYKEYTELVKNKYGLFVSEDANIKILAVEKGSVEFIFISIGLSVLILSSATAYKIIKSKKVSFEIPEVVKVKIKDE